MTDNSDTLLHEDLQDFLTATTPDYQIRPENAPAALEALLFAAGDPLPIEKIRQITGLERSVLEGILSNMAERFQRDTHRGTMLRAVEGSWLLCTKPEQAQTLERLFQPRMRPPLSQAAYETLAIIAYNQPVTRAQVESVRGVNSDSIISRLLERNLINEAGTLEAPGRPVLFATTEQFLLDFGLRSVKDLPPMEMLMYGTLRDFEETLEAAAGHPRDSQMTIEQLVHTLLPMPAEKPAVPADEATRPAGASLPDAEVLELSGALFGDAPVDSSEDRD